MQNFSEIFFSLKLPFLKNKDLPLSHETFVSSGRQANSSAKSEKNLMDRPFINSGCNRERPTGVIGPSLPCHDAKKSPCLPPIACHVFARSVGY
jgi:hypothetical protein